MRRRHEHPGLAWLVAAAALAILCAFASGIPASARARQDRGAAVGTAHHEVTSVPWVGLITINGPINPAVANFVQNAIDRTSSEGAAALVIQLDTPGGLLSSARRIVEALLNAPLPTIAYVAPSGAAAASAGTLITEAAAIAAMAPGTTIGAAHPVGESGANIKGAMGKKIENFTASFARNIARERGRNEQWMEKAVRESSAIGEDQALKNHVIDIVAPNLRSLLVQATGREVKVGGNKVRLELAGATIRRMQMTWGQSLLNALANPNLVYLLMLAGIVGLYFEFAHPGVYLPGVAGAICLLLALVSFEVLPINLTGFLLVFLGVALLIAETFVTSYGVLGAGGVIAFVIGSLFLINTAETTMRVNRGLIAGAAIAMSAIIVGLGWVIVHVYRRPVTTGPEGLIGEVGEVRDPIAPGVPGRVFVHGEHWRAVSDEPIGAGKRARVMAVRGLEIKVRRESDVEQGGRAGSLREGG